MPDELKPCPFCGSPAMHPGEWRADNDLLAECSNEECWFYTHITPLSRWQTRPIEDALRARVAALEAERDILREVIDHHKPILTGWFIDLSGLKDGWRLTGEWGDDNCVMRPLPAPPEENKGE